MQIARKTHQRDRSLGGGVRVLEAHVVVPLGAPVMTLDMITAQFHIQSCHVIVSHEPIHHQQNMI
jgi:hypothetical protein